ncbi:MAG: hypothetical protein AB7T49_06160 [Oligoflexales bacterium]
MKKIGLIGFVIVAVFIAIGLKTALNTGVKSPIWAEGKIVLDPQLKDHGSKLTTLYLVIYDLDSPRPMPYGAMRERLAENEFADGVYDFRITKEKLQIMGGGMGDSGGDHHPTNLRVKARLDFDGVAGVDQPGDVTGEVSPVPFGKSDLTITIDKLIE